MKKILLICCVFMLFAVSAFADTVQFKNDEELKGIVVEEYVDRIVISTYEGEKTIPKDGIRKIIYDLPEQNLIKLGDVYMARRELERAYFYYEKALQANSKSAIARDKMNYITGYLFRRLQQDKLREVKRRGELEKWPGGAPAEEESLEEKLIEKVGIRVDEDDNRMKVKEVKIASPAYRAGLRKNDIMVSVWGKMTGYMSKDALWRLFLEEGVGEIKTTIERAVVLNKEKTAGKNYRHIIGGKLDMLPDGLTLIALDSGGIGEKAGLGKGDLIIALNGASTRYMPLLDAIKKIESRSEKAITLTVRRDTTIWRN